MAWWREKEKKEIESSVAKCKKRREEAPREERRGERRCKEHDHESDEVEDGRTAVNRCTDTAPRLQRGQSFDV